MTLHEELMDRIDDLWEWDEDDGLHGPDYYCELAAGIEFLEKILCDYPPPREPRWWCRCGWVGGKNVAFFCPACWESLVPCGEMPWTNDGR